MKEKQFRKVYEEIDVPQDHVQNAIRTGIQGAEMKTVKRKRSIRYSIATAAVLVMTVATLSFSFPTFAEKVFGSVFELFEDNERNRSFNEHASHTTELGITKESNGVSLTFEEAVYDGEDVAIAFTLESERDLGDEPYIDWSYEDDVDAYMGGSQIIQRVDGNNYAGLILLSIKYGQRPETLEFTWEGNRIGPIDQDADVFELINPVEGDWSFKLSLDNIGSETKYYEDIETFGEDMNVSLRSITETPVSTVFYVRERVYQSSELLKENNDYAFFYDYTLTDDLGNTYPVSQDGAWGNDRYVTTARFLTSPIEDKAKKLYITPTVSIYKPIEDHDQEYGTPLEEAFEPFDLEPIEVPLD